MAGRVVGRAGPLRAFQGPLAGRTSDWSDGRLRPRRGVQRRRQLLGRAQQLVHPPQPGAVLEPRRLLAGFGPLEGRCLRHALHRAAHAVLGGGASPALGLGAHLPGPDRAGELPRDTELVDLMDCVREVCSAGHSVRKAVGYRARLPLASVTVAGERAPALSPFRELIADELNVKQVHLVGDVSGVADVVLQVNPAVLGPRLGPATQEVIAAVRRGSWQRLPGGAVEVAGHALGPEEFFVSLVPKDPRSARALPGNDMVLMLDLELTPELE